jgi:predicted RecA/RadA family phage recombinase
MADYLPIRIPGQALVATASAAITAGQIVEVSGNDTVAPAGAGSVKWLGVAAFDAKAGDRVTVHAGGTQAPKASGAVTAGDQVAVAADGAVATSADGAGAVVFALTNAVDGAEARVQFIR